MEIFFLSVIILLLIWYFWNKANSLSAPPVRKKTVEISDADLKRMVEASMKQSIETKKIIQNPIITEAKSKIQDYALPQSSVKDSFKKEESFIEENTSYSNQIRALFETNPQNYSFTSIRPISVAYIRNLPQEIIDQVYAELNNGIAILETESHLHSYFYAFGLKHPPKLIQAFDTFIKQNRNTFSSSPIELIDYGCGQELGSIILLDYLQKLPDLKYTITNIKLIEPSILALKRASLLIKYMLKRVNQTSRIETIASSLDDIQIDDLITDKKSIKIHLFSNILDIENFNLRTLHQKISDTQKGTNYYVCVSPNIHDDNTHIRNLRLKDFFSYFDVPAISHRHTNIETARGTIKRHEIVFKKEHQMNTLTSQSIDDDLPF